MTARSFRRLRSSIEKEVSRFNRDAGSSTRTRRESAGPSGPEKERGMTSARGMAAVRFGVDSSSLYEPTR